MAARKTRTRAKQPLATRPARRRAESVEGAPGKQALKTQRTREKLIGAVIALIKEGGYANASAARIAKRAGTTWGAAQHHFGSKDEILVAILDLSHARFSARMSDPELRVGSLSDRASRFVDRMWEHYQDDIFIVVLEILLATRGFHQAMPTLAERRHARAHHQLMRAIFHDLKLDIDRAREAMTFTHCALTGLAIEHVFEGKVRSLDRYLQRIKLTLQMMLSGM